MGRKFVPESTVDPRRLLPLIGQAQHVWAKLCWENAQIIALYERDPIPPDALSYSAVNFAITAKSLEDWLFKLAKKASPPLWGKPQDFMAAVNAAVTMQAAFRDIANTFKHGAHRDENWKGGEVQLVHFPAFTGDPRSMILFFHSDDGPTQTSLEVFPNAIREWGTFIETSGLFELMKEAARTRVGSW